MARKSSLHVDTYPAALCRHSGFRTVNAVAKHTGISASEIGRLLRCEMKSVFLQDGTYSAAARRFAEAFGFTPDLLFGPHPEADKRRLEAEQVFTAMYTATPEDPLDAEIRKDVQRQTVGVLQSLTPGERLVLQMRFGIGMDTDHTLPEVGQSFTVTRERIRQIELRALRKLKGNHRRKLPKKFLDK